MVQRIQEAFDQIICQDRLKKDTFIFVLDEIHRKKTHSFTQIKWAAVVCSLVIFVTGGLGGYGLYYTEAAAISIDINPSIELGVNHWGLVVNETGYGSDGNQVLSALSLRHMSYEKALEKLLTSDALYPYLKQGSVVSIALEADDEKEKKLLTELESCVETTLERCHRGVETEYVCADESLKKEAHDQGMSMGKYYAIRELLTVDPQATVEEFQDKSLQEIKDHMDTCRHGSRGRPDPDVEEDVDTGCSQEGYCGNHHHGDD